MVGLSLFVALLVGVVAWFALRDDSYVVPQPPSAGSGIEPGAATDTLAALQAAVETRDSDAAAALAVSEDGTSRTQLGALVANARALEVEDFTLRYVDEASGISADGEWTAAVDVTWAFGGFDQAPSRTEVLVRFRTGDDRLSIASIGGGDGRTPVWMAGPVSVRRTPSTLVLVSGEPDRIAEYEAVAESAIPVVRRVVTDWTPRLVVEVPPDAAGLDEALGAEAGEYANIAAVTTAADGSLAPDAPVHVFVNPEVFDRLGRIGAQVVMSHEATHVATDAPSSLMPLWLIEGFADYVALRDIDLPLTTTAGQIIEQVRRDGPPQDLPAPADFDTADSKLGAAYEAAWLASVVLAERGGQRGLVRFYDAVRSGNDLEASFEASFAWSQAEFLRAWRTRLTDVAA
ncbi:MAG: hypothetical protein WKF79_06815 [Nocardioides sp.]